MVETTRVLGNKRRLCKMPCDLPYLYVMNGEAIYYIELTDVKWQIGEIIVT